MAPRGNLSREKNGDDLSQNEISAEDYSKYRHKRIASVYDAVAGRVGFNGFLSQRQLDDGLTALRPEEVLLRRVEAPDRITHEYYNADEKLKPHQQLPDDGIVKAVHAYASSYYEANAQGEVNHNWRSLDETALLAFAILLEEASVVALGTNGDMVLVEPEGLENGLEESAITKHQIQGRVKPIPMPEQVAITDSSSDRSEEDIIEAGRKTKRRRNRYGLS